MVQDQRRAVWVLGACQCVFWGVLYYSFSVLLVPMESGLGLSRAAVAGSFSLGLCAMAVAAPAIGRALDAGHAARVTRLGAGLALAGLSVVALAHSAPVLYLGWACIGTAMAMLLYESAFALVSKAIAADSDRLRALAAVTVMGGLASTIFLPVLSLVVDHWGWRAAVWGNAAAVAAAAAVMERHVLPNFPAENSVVRRSAIVAGPWPPYLARLVAVFSSGTMASMALTTLLIPLMIERGAPSGIAALVLAALGLAQLPGRIWLLRRGNTPDSRLLNGIPLCLQAVGLFVVVVFQAPASAAAGVIAFGCGAGLHTLARPWMIQALYGPASAGRWNGEVARIQGFARAAGPVLAAAASQWVGSAAVLGAAGGLLGLALAVAGTIPPPKISSQLPRHGAS
ncbi:MFS transporter [Agrilutibacter solisilvae]|uniref:MFS transporter n=1 Tax=Agrilutibacter solisilvae TaxID=2763317 RepID=A0A974XX98_9GAMM|nr:MFS transporter [Lysobacter solisilvae]QSX77489.1 MFS transporter [Lysobacter solisilvae]